MKLNKNLLTSLMAGGCGSGKSFFLDFLAKALAISLNNYVIIDTDEIKK